MKTGILCIFAILCISLILVAGCTTGAPGNTGTASNTGIPGTPNNALPAQDETAVLVNGTYAINVSINQITADRLQSGSHEVNIFITAENTGTAPVQLRWFSRITDADGNSFGGVGVSHGGYGAETDPIMPGGAETPRDYVIIGSDNEYAALSRGATIEVFFVTEPLTNETPVSFSTEWNLDPAIFT